VTPKSALDALKEFTEQKIAPLLLLMKEPDVRDIRSREELETEYVHPYVDIGTVPHKNFQPLDFQCPMILWAFDETQDDGNYTEGRIITLRAYVSTYGGGVYKSVDGVQTKIPDNKSYVDLLNVLETMYQQICKDMTAGGKLSLHKPITFGVYDGAFYPYSYGYFQVQAEIPACEQSDTDGDFFAV
jgi:hypothetical protein